MIDDKLKFNHHPLQRGIRFRYNGWRYKTRYDITLYSGKSYGGCYPNANAWQTKDIDVRRVKDEDVQYIQFTSDKDLNEYERFDSEEARSNFILEGWHVNTIPIVKYIDGVMTFHPQMREVCKNVLY